MQRLIHLLKDGSGATAVEYAVVAFAITLAIVLAVNGFGLH
jgi:Flp pilus assembly pilin Flp